MMAMGSPTEAYHLVGQPIPRLDSLDKLTGAARYAADLTLPGLLHVKLLRSKLAHARILRLDTSRARRLVGVKGIVTRDDCPRHDGRLRRTGAFLLDLPIFADERVRFVGEPIAAVAATSRDLAEEALELIDVEYEELPAVFDPRDALKEDAPLIHPDLLAYEAPPNWCTVRYGNVCQELRIRRGDVHRAVDSADAMVEGDFSTHSHHQCYMEPNATVAQVESNGYVTVWTSTQAPFEVRREVNELLGIPSSKLRVIAPPVGGGFGGKVDVRVEPHAILLAQKTGRPCKVVLTRAEELQTGHPRHPYYIHLETYARRDGTIVARTGDLICDAGAYAHQGPGVGFFAIIMGAGPYRIPNQDVRSRLVYTNKVPFGAFRGYGGPQIHFAAETQIDELAEKLGLDPVEMRLINGMEAGDKVGVGQAVENVGHKECLGRAASAIGWGTPKRPASGSKRFGRGVGSLLHVSGMLASGALVKLEEDGAFTVLVGAPEIGGGQKTVLAQIAAESLGVPLDQVVLVHGDTLTTPYDWSTDASRTTFNVGNAIVRAAAEVREQILAIAAEMLEANREDLRVEQGAVFIAGSPDRRKSFGQIAMYGMYARGGVVLGKGSYFGQPALDGQTVIEGGFCRAFPAYSFGTQIAEVEVDVETGEVRVLRLASAHDVGRAVNPPGCEGQIEGAMAIGIGWGLTEELVFGDGGQVTNPTYVDYRIVSPKDMPEVIPILIEDADPNGPFGAKGLGECGLVPTVAAINNAIYDAIGVRVKALPITPEKILAALDEVSRH